MSDQAAKDALAETQARIFAISLGPQAALQLGRRALRGARRISRRACSTTSRPRCAARATARRSATSSSRCKLQTDASINLGVVVTEWVTNAFKYAYPDRRGEVRVRLKRLRRRAAPSWWSRTTASAAATTAPAKGTGLGTRIVKAMAQTMGAEIEYLARAARDRRAAGLSADGRLTFAASLVALRTGNRVTISRCARSGHALQRTRQAMPVRARSCDGRAAGVAVPARAGIASLAQDGPPGITVPMVFPPFDPQRAGLQRAARPRRRSLAFAQDNEREFMQGVGRGLAAGREGPRARLPRRARRQRRARKMIEQVQALRAAKVGAVVAAPVDPLVARAAACSRSSGPAPMSAPSCRRPRPRCSTRRNT